MPFSICAPWFTLPYSVASPTSSTRMIPLPSTTVVPRSTLFDGYVASSSKSASTVVLAIIGSPVSVDSLICNDCACSSTPSAGTSSPVFNITTSPTTTSLREISCTLPSRRTVTIASSLTVFSTSNARAAFTSKIKPIPLASTMAKNMPMGSRNAEKPACSGPQQCTHDITIESSQAMSRMRMIGSSNFSRNFFHNDSRAGGVSTFSPYLRRLSSTCCRVSPTIFSSNIIS